jgi:hypothetical protein
MATVLDIVTDALNEIGVLAAGEVATADDGAVALRSLNRMINAWKAERVYIYQTTRTTWSITANDGSYTVGTGGDVSVLRPVRIDHVAISDSAITPATEVPLRLMTDADYARIAIKTQTSNWPEAAYYNLTYPLATLTLWPVPTSTTLTGVLYAPQAAAEFSALATAVSLPPGYERFVVKNLALELAPQYGATPSQDLKEQAKDAKAVVLRVNKRLVEMQFDPGAGGSARAYDIYSDQP